MEKIKIPKFFGMHANPPTWLSISAGALPFVIMVACYLWFSAARNRDNPDEKLMPTPTKIYHTFKGLVTTQDVKTGKYIFWDDTRISLKRFLTASLIASLVALWFGMNMALFKGMDSALMPFLRFLNTIPPPVILPILFIVFGVEELSKIVLIVLSMTPSMALAMYTTVSKLAGEQIVRSFTLGASQLDVVYRVILPQTIPRLIEVLRNNLGMAWYSLLLAEAMSASAGIGYRIFLVRRYTAMDVIIPYALWVVALGYLMNWCLSMILKWKYRWYLEIKEA